MGESVDTSSWRVAEEEGVEDLIAVAVEAPFTAS